MPRSMSWPVSGSRSALSAARLGSGSGPVSASTAGTAPGPDTRTTATPARPGADDRAHMVSLEVTNIPRLGTRCEPGAFAWHGHPHVAVLACHRAPLNL